MVELFRRRARPRSGLDLWRGAAPAGPVEPVSWGAMALFPDTRFDDWTRRDVGSFARRYFEPLWRVARLDFPGIDEDTAQDLAQAFLTRELERTPVFERYEPGGPHQARFRTYLRACFWRFCRDELSRAARRPALPLDALPADPPDPGTSELERLVARDLLRSLRARVLDGGRGPLPPDAARYFELKWPLDIHAAPRSDAEVGAALGLPRGAVRTLKRRVVDRILLALRLQLREEGLAPDAVDRALEGYLSALGREDAGGPA